MSAPSSWCLVLVSLLWMLAASTLRESILCPTVASSLFITRASLPLKLAVGHTVGLPCESSVCHPVTRSSRAVAHLGPKRLLASLTYVLGIIQSTLDLGMLLSDLVGRGSHSLWHTVNLQPINLHFPPLWPQSLPQIRLVSACLGLLLKGLITWD